MFVIFVLLLAMVVRGSVNVSTCPQGYVLDVARKQCVVRVDGAEVGRDPTTPHSDYLPLLLLVLLELPAPTPAGENPISGPSNTSTVL